jgi:hypothetical protein
MGTRGTKCGSIPFRWSTRCFARVVAMGDDEHDGFCIRSLRYRCDVIINYFASWNSVSFPIWEGTHVS